MSDKWWENAPLVAAQEPPQASLATPEPTRAASDAAWWESAPLAADQSIAWSDVPGQAWSNLGPSAANFASSMVQPILHPIETAKNVGHLAYGVGSKLVDAIPGVEMDPEAKAERESTADAFGQHYKDRYGSVEGFKRALATDPVGVAADAGTALTLGGGALARAPGVAGTLGKVVKETGRAVDPIANLGRAASGIADVVSPRGASKLKDVPSIDGLKAASRAAYKSADDAGVVVAQPALKQLHAEVMNDLADAGYKPQLAARIKVALDDIEDLATKVDESDMPVHATLKGLDQTRKVVKAAGKSIDPYEQMLSAKIIDRIDDLMDGLDKPGMTVMGDASKGAAALKEARATWHQARKAELIDDAIEAAKLRAGTTGSGANVENAIRQELRKLISNKKTARTFTKEEKAAIRAVAVGTAPQNILRGIGKLAPSGIVSMGLSGGIGAAVGSTVGMPTLGAIAVPAAGLAAKKSADRGTRLSAEALRQNALSGQIGKSRPHKAPEGAVRAGYASGVASILEEDRKKREQDKDEKGPPIRGSFRVRYPEDR